MVSVKIPSIKGATVAGIAIQGANAADNLQTCIPKILGDFAMSPTYLRGISGAANNGYQFADTSVSTTQQQFTDAILGYYFVPLYNVQADGGSITLLITNDTGAAASEFLTFTPILNLSTSGSGERTPKQTASVATGSKQAILQRAEEGQ